METSHNKKIAKFTVTQVLLIAAVGIIVTLLMLGDFSQLEATNDSSVTDTSAVDQSVVTPTDGIALPIAWDDVGIKMVAKGVIDIEVFESIYQKRGGLDEQSQAMLYDEVNSPIIINPENAGSLLNIFWAFGLSNKNPILEEGPMQDEAYGGAQNFASTGGWTIAKGDTMDHYSAYKFVTLTKEQQELVERVAKNIYRPCCGNSVYFPDCNHGMAMLGLLELLAAQGIGEEEMYQIALQVNAYWFPSVYQTIASYFASEGIAWDEVDAKLALGEEYSSGYGFSKVLEQVQPTQGQTSPGCSV